MFLDEKIDFQEAKLRTEAWWNGEIIDRVAIKVTAPEENNKNISSWIISTAFPSGTADGSLMDAKSNIIDLESYFWDPEIVIPRLEEYIRRTCWLGEAFPLMFPVSISMPAILAAYLGAPMKYINTMTTWIGTVIGGWDDKKDFRLEDKNKSWAKSRILLEKASREARGKYMVGIQDLNGPGEILAVMRGHTELSFDLIEDPQSLTEAMGMLNRVWFECWQACYDIIHKYMPGYINWLAVWSEQPAADLQCDYSALISSEHFNKYFLPFLTEQAERIDRTIYHLDGPGAIRHLDCLLGIKDLNGIQWVPGAGKGPMIKWMELLQKIQEAGKILYITCTKEEVETLVKGLSPRGLMIDTSCGSIAEAEKLIRDVKKWT